MKALFSTYNSFSLFIIRLALGIVILPHGLQKTVGLFGGYGFSATLKFLTEQAHLPSPIAILVIAAESLGALGLIFGCVTRVAALGILAVMAGAIATVHFKFGFFMNWTGKQAGEGFEFHILAIAMALVLLLAGGGKFSIDRAIARSRD